MLKALFTLIVALAGLTAFSQNTLKATTYPTNALDTVTNTGVKYMTSAAIGGFQKTVVVTVTGTKISGTVAGTASLEGSLDGSNWYSMSGTTYTMTDVATQTYAWFITDFGSQYVRVKWAGTGTMAAAISGKVLARKPQ